MKALCSQRAFHLAEDRGLVIPQFRQQPVLREQKDFSVCFPDAVAVHPVPEFALVVTYRCAFFQIEEHSLHEKLRGRDSLQEPCSLQATPGLNVNQIALI